MGAGEGQAGDVVRRQGCDGGEVGLCGVEGGPERGGACGAFVRVVAADGGWAEVDYGLEEAADCGVVVGPEESWGEGGGVVSLVQPWLELGTGGGGAGAAYCCFLPLVAVGGRVTPALFEWL